MNKRQGVYTTDDKSYRGSDRDACRGTVARIATRRPSPPPPLEAEVGSNVSNAEFNVLCSVFERFRAIESAAPRKRGSRRTTPLPPPTPDRGVPLSLSLSLSIPSRSTFLLLPLSIRLSLAANSEHARRVNAPKAPNERPTEPTIYPFCLPTYPSTYLSPLIHSPLLGIPNW